MTNRLVVGRSRVRVGNTAAVARACAALALAFALAPLTAEELAAATVRAEIGDLVIEAPLGLEREVERLAEASRRIVPQLERDLGARARGPYRIVLLPSAGQLEPELQSVDQLAPPWAARFLVGSLRLGAVRLGQVRSYPYDSAEEVLAHEVAHMLLYDAARGPLPPWFSEGVATFEGRRRGIRDFVVNAATVLAREPPTLARIDADFGGGPERARRAYGASLDFVAWSVRRYGADFVPRVVAGLDTHPLEDAWQQAAGESLSSSERRWRRASVWFHRWIPLLGGTSTLWIAIALLAVLAGLARRRRDRLIRARWDAEESVAIGEPSDEVRTPPS